MSSKDESIETSGDPFEDDEPANYLIPQKEIVLEQQLAVLGPGCSFGVQGLLTNKPRLATIKCLQKCHFLVLSKAAYFRSLEAIEKRKLKEKIDFVKQLPLFNRLTRTYLNKFTASFQSLHCFKDKFLYKEGDPAKAVYIVKEGVFQVSKRAKVTEKDQEKQMTQVLVDPLGSKQS